GGRRPHGRPSKKAAIVWRLRSRTSTSTSRAGVTRSATRIATADRNRSTRIGTDRCWQDSSGRSRSDADGSVGVLVLAHVLLGLLTRVGLEVRKLRPLGRAALAVAGLVRVLGPGLPVAA